MTLKAVIFDYGVLFKDDPDTVRRLRKLLERLKKLGLKVVVFSTYDRDVDTEMERRGFPPADQSLFGSMVGKRKGSPRWVEMAAARLRIETFQFVYVGDDKQDWRTAMGAAVFYMHASWSEPLPEDVTAVTVDRPLQILAFISHFLLTPPRFEYSLDVEDHRLCVRSLMNAVDTTLPSTAPSETFTLQDVFYRGHDVRVGTWSARNVLMFHLLGSAYLEGLIVPNSRFTVYPSHSPGSTSSTIAGFLEPASRLLGGYFRPDLIKGGAEATDMSRERFYASRGGPSADETFENQTNTVYLNPDYQNLVRTRKRNVLVFDDFTTTSKSLEWARNLLYAGGADRVVLLTIGKYLKWGSPAYWVYEPETPGLIEPYELTSYADSDFEQYRYTMTRDPAARRIITNSFQGFKDRKLYPVERTQ